MLACMIYVSVLFFLSSDLTLSPQPEGFFLVKTSFFLLLLWVYCQGQAPGSCEAPRDTIIHIRFYTNKAELNLIARLLFYYRLFFGDSGL